MTRHQRRPLVIVKHCAKVGILDDVLDRFPRQFERDRHRDHACPHDPEIGRDHRRRIQRHDADAVALLQPLGE
jgi:hypothetical protein